MRKKDYELIAGILAEHANNADFEHQPIIDDVARAFARVFAIDNPKFDRQKFLTACGIEDGASFDLESGELTLPDGTITYPAKIKQ